jgi:hypothetical protein
VPPVSTLMNCCARAGAADSTAATAMAAAINFELVSVILPWISSGKWTGERPRSTYPIGQKQD